ncbi:MAG TPA: SUMF1/EgtB/PvdO family nonheme iron enzyme [Pyrinomonadaceae bacterium]|jgi:formylglycine-generating enzyme required for sulfatase activity
MNVQLRQHYRVFVASPGDVREEREIVPAVIEQVNRTTGQELGIHLDSWMWDMDAAPNAGAPQDVINPELDQAHIVIVIFWNRLGTPTLNADSGTVEEFTRAFERWQQKGLPRLMVYFCERPAFLRTAQERMQALQVSNFREKISGKVLAQSYENTTGFERRLLQDFPQVCRDMLKGASLQELATNPAPAEPNLDAYVEHVKNVCGSIVLTGLLRERAAPAVPLDEVYVSLTVTRTDLGSETENRAAAVAPGGAVATLAAYLRRHEQLPESVPGEVRELIEQALLELGVPESDAREEYAAPAAYRRLRANVDQGSSVRFSSQSVRDTLRTFPIEEAFQHTKYLLVEGAPGSGKTTILMRVAMALAKALRGDTSSALEMGFTEPYPVPVFVPLRHFWTYWRNLPPAERIFVSASLLLKYLHVAIGQHTHDNAWLTSFIESGRVALLLDGLDEVPDEVGRQQASGIIRDFVRKFPKCRVALTTRPAGLTTAIRNNLLTQGRLSHCEVRPLNQEQVARFISAWYRALVTNPVESARKAQELIKRIDATPRVSELARTPILLTAIAVVHQSRGDLPERRADLYDHCVKALIGRWDAAKDEEGRQLTGEYAEDTKLSLLQEIAFVIHDQGGDARTIERGPLLRLLNKRLYLDSKQPPTFEKYNILLEYMVDRTGLIIPEGDTTYRFRHLSFQEFLTARHICDRADDAVEELAPRLADPWWREVVQLAPAYKALNSISDARRLLANLAVHARTQAEPESHASAFGTIARALLDLQEYKVERLEETATEIKQDFMRVLDDPTQPGETRVRAEIAECVGQFGDPRLTNEARWVTISAGEYWRGLSSPEGFSEQQRIDQTALPVIQLHLAGDSGNTLRLEIWDVPGNKRVLAEVPEDVPVERVVAVLVETLRLPKRRPGGGSACYNLHHRRLGILLLSGQTLGQQQVMSGDVLRIQPEITGNGGGAAKGWISVSEFRIQRWPVTVSEYRTFVDEMGYTRRQWWDEAGWEWLQGESVKFPDRWEWQIDKAGNYPVVGLSWWEAHAYCRWYSTMMNGLPSGWTVRLPTEAEWEKAARGGKTLADGTPNRSPQREYPWVGDWQESRANSGEGDWLAAVTPVGCFPKGFGPYGTWDQSGNVWEWCLDWHDPQAYARAEQVDPVVDDPKSVPKVFVVNNRGEKVLAPCRVTKGGSWTADRERARISFRNRLEPSKRLDDQGFRCAAVPSSTKVR